MSVYLFTLGLLLLFEYSHWWWIVNDLISSLVSNTNSSEKATTFPQGANHSKWDSVNINSHFSDTKRIWCTEKLNLSRVHTCWCLESFWEDWMAMRVTYYTSGETPPLICLVSKYTWKVTLSVWLILLLYTNPLQIEEVISEHQNKLAAHT